MKRLISTIILIQLTFLNADNYSLSFDGNDDYIDVEYSTGQIGSEISILSWVNIHDDVARTIIFNGCCGTDATWYWGLSLREFNSGDGIQPTAFLQTDQSNVGSGHFPASGVGAIEPNSGWHHVAMTYSNNTLNLYLDGISVHAQTIYGDDIFESGDLTIAGWDNGGGNFLGSFNGLLDEVAVFNQGLSTTEVQYYMDSGLTGSENELVGYWNFNEGTGTTLTDLSGNENDGTINGATWSTDVPPTSGGNNALSFDGDDGVDCGNDDSFDFGTGDFTVEAWINPANVSQNARIVARGHTGAAGAYQLAILDSRLRIAFHNVGAESEYNIIQEGAWQYLVLTRNGNTVKGYVNAVEVIDYSNSLDLTSDQPLVIGYEPGQSSFFDGLIDEVAIWNIALSESEIQSYMNTSPTGNESDIVGYWNFNEGTGTTLTDQTSNDNDGTITGASWTGNGAPVTEAITATNTHSLSFDGESDYVSINDLNNISWGSQLSIQAWIKISTNVAEGITPRIFESDGNGGNKIVFYLVGSGDATRLEFFLNGTEINGSTDLVLNQWHHVAVTYNSSSIKLYLNGSEEASGSTETSVVFQSTSYISGLHGQNGASPAFNGLIDEVSLWSAALNQSEIQNNMSTELNGNETGLVGYWNFNEGSGTTLTDQTSNGNDGTINGATWSTDVPFSGTTTTSALTWSVQAQASLGSYNDNDNYLGVASDATNTFDASYDEVESPASPGSSVSLYFPHEEWDYLLGDNFSSDIRPEVTLTDTMQVWDFEVSSTDAGEATLTFAFTDVPDVPVILENTATGARQTLSNNAAYTFTAVADSAHPFRVSIGDTTSPSLLLGSSCSGPAILISDSTHSLGWTSTDGFEVDSVMVSFSSDSGTTYTLQAALGAVSGYDWTVPDAIVMTGGKFKVKSQDYAGNSVEKVSDYVFAIAGDSLSSAITAGWTLWGAPIDPANDTMSVNLDDDFSNYWVTYDYVDNGYTYDGILLEGEGYWLGAAQSATIDVKGTPIASDFTMGLSPGWELISNPLVLDVNVDSLTFTKNDTTKTHAEAVTAGWVNSIYGYDGAGYTAASTFSPWSGYWVAVLETGVEMTFPIHRHDGSGSGRSRDEYWMIAFDAEVEGANDEMMRIGYAETATDGFDAEHDAVNPPNPPGPVYISLFTNHPEWDYFLGDQFTKDIRAEVPENGYQEWILSMESSESDAQISWTFENVPDEYDIGYSINDGVYFEDMRSVSTTTLSISTEIIVRVGTQVLGIDDEPIPEVFALHQNYPNPFNPTTQIRYDLPEDANVNITIYDIIGRSIKSLVNSKQTAGYRSIRWDGKNNLGEGVSAGMYIYMIQAGGFRQVRKMILLK